MYMYSILLRGQKEKETKESGMEDHEGAVYDMYIYNVHVFLAHLICVT